ncbi:MAG: hypothetical protein A2Z34_01275 [Planctomycetes bacterium RBG_16_59_8]|nr:MAG: hypothetical protein A2Z34_01275 [Planctomycetes bacterium RBG_16_59_8]
MVSSLTESGRIDIVDLDARKDMQDEFQYHTMGYIDPATVKGPGKELGADYILSGRIISELHKGGDVKVIHYQTTLQLIDLSTNVIRWSVTTEIKKSQVK